MPDAHGPEFVTNWIRREPYELAEVIPFGWKIPTVRATAIGRNVGLFETLMRWAGQPVNFGFDVLPAAMAVNAGLSDPLPEREVYGISKSVERYRTQWRKRGQFDQRGDQQRSLWGRERGVRSGAARRKLTADRDAAITEAVRSGRSMRNVAREFCMTAGNVHLIVHRVFSELNR